MADLQMTDLRLADLTAMIAADRELLDRYLDTAPRQFDIDTALKRFLQEPRTFRERLRDVGGLISGGFALQFLAGVQWIESDLDICVQKDKAQGLIDHLVEVEGYDLASRKIGKYNWSEVEEVHAYDKPTDDPNVFKMIEIIFTRGDPIKSVITETYTTALVNVISYNTAYSLFPIPTLDHNLTFSLKQPDWFHNVLLRKYRSRGYVDVQRLPSAEEEVAAGGCFSQKIRRVGDPFTRKVALPTSGMLGPEPPSNIENVFFKILEGDDVEDGTQWMILKPLD